MKQQNKRKRKRTELRKKIKGQTVILQKIKPHWQQQEIEQILWKMEIRKRRKGQRRN